MDMVHLRSRENIVVHLLDMWTIPPTATMWILWFFPAPSNYATVKTTIVMGISMKKDPKISLRGMPTWTVMAMVM